jgi:hypothetical protein
LTLACAAEFMSENRGRLAVRREAVRLDVPPDWQLTLILAGVAVGLLAVLLFEVAKWYL